MAGRLEGLGGEAEVRERHGEQDVAPHRARLPPVQRARAHLHHHLVLAHLDRKACAPKSALHHRLVLAHLDRKACAPESVLNHHLVLAHLGHKCTSLSQ